MPLRRHLHVLTGGPLIVSGILFAMLTWWSPLSGQTASPEDKIYFAATSTTGFACDANQDGKINEQDVSILKLYWKGFPQPDIDCNQNGFVNSQDLAIIVGEWTGDSLAIDTAAIPARTGASDAPVGYYIATPTRKTGPRPVGDRYTALIVLSGGGLTIGAGEMMLSYNASRLAVRAVRTSPSIWTYWTERPHPPYGSRLVFSGGRPKGFTGSRGVIAEVELEVLKEGDGELRIQSGEAYRTDPAGTPANIANDPMRAPGMSYDGAAPRTVDNSVPVDNVYLYAVSAPAYTGRRWVIDLSSLSTNADIPSFEIQDGTVKSVQRDDVYALQPSSLSSRVLDVFVHSEDGSVRHVIVNVLLPGESSSVSFWQHLSFWVFIELGLACFALWLIFRRRR